MPRGISSDGSVVAGYSTTGGVDRAFRWQGGTLQDLGTLGGTWARGWALSGDGSVVVGWSATGSGSAYHAFRWDAVNGMVDLGTLGGTNSDASGVSSNGSVVVGSSFIAGDAFEHAFRWDAVGGMVDLDTLGGDTSNATHLSSDGSVVVGFSENASGEVHAFRWEAGLMKDLGTLGGSSSTASAVSGDGKVVIGNANTTTAGSGAAHAFRWDGGPMQDLGTFGGTSSTAVATNYDGSVVVGHAQIGGDTAYHAFRWEGGAKVDLGSFGGNSFAFGVSRDGSVVVGHADANGARHAFRWTDASGMQDLNTLLASAGVNMSGIVLYDATRLSTDGQFIAGNASFAGAAHAYLVRYYDGVGGVTDTQSLQQSVNALGDSRAGMMAQQHGLANPLLGGDKPLTNDNEVGVFGMGGSAAGGGFARYANSGGLALLAGVSYGEEAYQDAAIEDSLMGALALRWLHPGKSLWRPLVEVGGWLAPEADMEFQRTYMNGAGTTTGVGSTHGDVSYLYARAGVVFDLGKREQIVVSGEIGHERLEVDGYAEALSAGNPFNATVAPGTDAMDLAKARLAWSFGIAPRMDATLWGAGVYGFNRETELLAAIAGIGVLAPVAEDHTVWAEYGARVGYAVTEAVTFDVFANGVSGDDDIGTRVHGGGGLRYRF